MKPISKLAAWSVVFGAVSLAFLVAGAILSDINSIAGAVFLGIIALSLYVGEERS